MDYHCRGCAARMQPTYTGGRTWVRNATDVLSGSSGHMVDTTRERPPPAYCQVCEPPPDFGIGMFLALVLLAIAAFGFVRGEDMAWVALGFGLYALWADQD